MIEKLKITASDTAIILKINELVDAVNVLQAQVAILEEHAHPTATTKPAKNAQDRMIGCTTLDIPESYKNNQLTLATLDYSKKLEKENSELKDELERTRKENEDKQAVLNCVVDMLKTLNQKYTLIMGKDVIKETVRLLEQTKGGDNEK
jgi:hypothetical protein